ncbi:spike base protein, RCAP_Rcc01079 family [Aliiroseovarius sp. PTFE2010]|uniref:spike base protein, RCAP_Rcc01079 family n=1 Tax=Aliiroseovarius sp. PTFE2010 TaxID=3417190 RepID=UPI003CF952E9
MKNPFENRALPLNGPAHDILPVIPDDGTDLPEVAVALYVESGGTITFNTVKGAVRTVSVSDFAILPVGVSRVQATGTTASGIHALMVS